MCATLLFVIKLIRGQASSHHLPRKGLWKMVARSLVGPDWFTSSDPAAALHGNMMSRALDTTRAQSNQNPACAWHAEVLVAHSRHRRSMRGVSSSRPCCPSGSRRSCSAGTGRAPPRRTKPAKPANSCVVRGSPGGASVVQWWWWSLWKWGGVDGARTVLPSCASDPLTRLVPPLISGFSHR